jgi:murein DD-endopeptidase MepM/ murein hydrolase activator NlpD
LSSRHRSTGGEREFTALDEALERVTTRARGAHRIAPPSSVLRGRVVVAAVAVGAFAAAAAGQTLQSAAHSDDIAPLAGTRDAAAMMGSGGDAVVAPELLTLTKTSDGTIEAQKMVSSERVTQARNARAAEVQAKQAEATRPKTVKPANGTFTSGFGARWGTTHYGIDLANRIGTPILAAADGTVIEAGTASGFGLWVRIQHADGTVTVYGHVNDYSVREGQKVKAGQQIARMGNRGQSTGPHLHFEVWDESGRKMNPLTWLNARGVSV